VDLATILSGNIDLQFGRASIILISRNASSCLICCSFQNNTVLLHTRVQGYDIAHISEGDGALPPLEGPINWNESILTQRHFWSRHSRYDKPLLSKVSDIEVSGLFIFG